MSDRQRAAAVRAQQGQRRDGVEHEPSRPRRQRAARPIDEVLARDARARAADRPKRPPG